MDKEKELEKNRKRKVKICERHRDTGLQAPISAKLRNSNIRPPQTTLNLTFSTEPNFLNLVTFETAKQTEVHSTNSSNTLQKWNFDYTFISFVCQIVHNLTLHLTQ